MLMLGSVTEYTPGNLTVCSLGRRASNFELSRRHVELPLVRDVERKELVMDEVLAGCKACRNGSRVRE
jgi:hypothetical protein